jgi:hypothetical protein
VGGDQFQFATGANNVLNGLNFAANTTVNINTAQTVATAANINRPPAKIGTDYVQ